MGAPGSGSFNDGSHALIEVKLGYDEDVARWPTERIMVYMS